MLILRVGPTDDGEYKVVIENKLGTAESSMMLNVRGIVLGFKIVHFSIKKCVVFG